jgi:hypothetical protein
VHAKKNQMLYGLDNLRYVRIVNPAMYSRATSDGTNHDYIMARQRLWGPGDPNRFRLFAPLQ